MFFILPYVKEHLNRRVRWPRDEFPICTVPHSVRVPSVCRYVLVIYACDKEHYFVKEAKIKRNEMCSV